MSRTSIPLQNHPGELVYPVRSTSLEDAPKRSRVIVHGLLLLGILVGGVGMIWTGIVREMPEPSPLGLTVGVLLTVAGAAALVVALLQARRAVTARAREQRLYYALGGLTPLTPRAYAAIQLDGHNIATGCWSETLEPCPVEVRLPQPHPTFRALPVYPREEILEDLDGSWGVLSAEGYRAIVQQLFEGMHSAPFASIAAGPDAREMGQRLGELLGTSAQRVAQAAEPVDGRPPALLWAFDLWRIVRISRDAYAAGLVSEDEAWTTIYRASDWIHAIFPSLEEFQLNLRLGHAFWCNNLQQINERKRNLDAFFANDPPRPVRDAPWVQADVELPPYVLDGFAAARREALEVGSYATRPQPADPRDLPN